MKEKQKNAVTRRSCCHREGVPEMIDRIIQEHHPSIRRNVSWLKQVFAKVVQIHDHEYPEIVPVYMLFLQISDDLERHMIKEESVIFPYLVKMEKALKEGKHPDPAGLKYRGGDNPLQIIRWEHEGTQQDWAELRKVTSDFTAPSDCSFIQAVYWGLRRLEPDLDSHLDLEINRLYRQVEKSQWLQ